MRFAIEKALSVPFVSNSFWLTRFVMVWLFAWFAPPAHAQDSQDFVGWAQLHSQPTAEERYTIGPITSENSYILREALDADIELHKIIDVGSGALRRMWI